MKNKPKLFIAFPCYDSVKIETMVSIFNLAVELTKANLYITIKTIKSPLIHKSRNYLASAFLATDCNYMLFIDSDLEFKPDAIIRMLVAKKDIILTPYRAKTPISQHTYPVEFKEEINVLPGDLIEVNAGPTGLMLIHRNVFEKIMKQNPELKIKNKINVSTPEDYKYYYNFFDLSFKDGITKNEDITFCNLAIKSGFKIYANIKSTVAHHGDYSWVGKIEDIFD